MRGIVPCAVCGKLSRHFLFRDGTLGISICSKKCEYEYLKNLPPSATEHKVVVSYLDNRIREYGKRNKIGWVVSGVGALLFLLGFLIPDVNTFIAGNITVVIGALATRHFEDTAKKLTVQRKRLKI